VRGRSAIAFVVLATVLPTVVAYSVAAGADGGPEPLGPGLVTVEVTTHYSHYSHVLDDLEVYEGTLVRFVVKNEDPIHHELIIGGPAVHAAHEKGHEAAHPPVPGELSVDPGQTGLTIYRFDEPGEVRFACHLPRHVAYGMTGDITVVPVSS
jgi:uncharacterized cupredoxin-like copper-binding protein